MKSDKTSRAAELLMPKVHEILLQDWDPIGIQEFAKAQDEYDSYISTICRLLLEEADTYKIREHLHQIRTVSMGLSENRVADEKVAATLKQLVPPPN